MKVGSEASNPEIWSINQACNCRFIFGYLRCATVRIMELRYCADISNGMDELLVQV